jgi:hypothetical protein
MISRRLRLSIDKNRASGPKIEVHFTAPLTRTGTASNRFDLRNKLPYSTVCIGRYILLGTMSHSTLLKRIDSFMDAITSGLREASYTYAAGDRNGWIDF